MAPPVRLEIVVPRGYTIVAGKAQLRRVLTAAGREVAAVARGLIKGGGKNRASTPGGPPVNRTGLLASSFRVRASRDGESVRVVNIAQSRRGSHAFYALFLEDGSVGGRGSGKKGVKGVRNKRRKAGVIPAGARVQAARPFLTTALERVENNGLAQRIEEAIIGGLKFQRGKY